MTLNFLVIQKLLCRVGQKVTRQSKKIYSSVSLLSKDFRSVFHVMADNLNTYYDYVALYAYILANYVVGRFDSRELND